MRTRSRRYGGCDDGETAEAVDDTVATLLAQRWNELMRSADAVEGDAGFRSFLDPGSSPTWVPPESTGSDAELAEILYTSGSTGLPKGVPLGHYGQLWAIGHYLEPLPEAPPLALTL